MQEASERFTLNSTRRWCSQSEFRISNPARIYRELKTITLLAPFYRADRNRIAVLAGCGDSHRADHTDGISRDCRAQPKWLESHNGAAAFPGYRPGAFYHLLLCAWLFAQDTPAFVSRH